MKEKLIIYRMLDYPITPSFKLSNMDQS